MVVKGRLVEVGKAGRAGRRIGGTEQNIQLVAAGTVAAVVGGGVGEAAEDRSRSVWFSHERLLARQEWKMCDGQRVEEQRR